MDQWATQYLNDWKTDFKNEPDIESSLRFLDGVLASFKQLKTNTDLKEPTATHETIASRISHLVFHSDKKPEALLKDLQALIFEAAVNSPLDAGDVAKVTASFIQGLPPYLAGLLEDELCLNTRVRWSGMCQPRTNIKQRKETITVNLSHSVGPDMPDEKKSKAQYIQEWLSFNIFIAHLTNLNAAPLEEYGLLALERVVPPINPRKIDYYIRAAEGWLRVWGKVIYVCSASEKRDPDVFNQVKWDRWKDCFERFWTSGEGVDATTRLVAKTAWYVMCDLEEGREIVDA